MREILSLILKVSSIATAALVTSALSAFAATNVLAVGGQTGQFSTISEAVGAANTDTNLANDYVISIAPGTYTNDTAQITRPMTIQAAVHGSAVILNQTAPLANERGILLTSANLTVDGLTLQNAANRSGNGAGIRAAQGRQTYTLTVRNTMFINNQTGILTDSFPLDTVLIDNVFINNGNPNSIQPGGTTHAVYINGQTSLVAIGNEICGTNIGHGIKSRAAVNFIQNNTIYAGAADPNQPGCAIGSGSFALDLSNGGAALVIGNTMIKGPASRNAVVISGYGLEGLLYPTNSLVFINNTMNSTNTGSIGILQNPSSAIPVFGNSNTFAGLITTPVSPASADQLTGTGTPPLSPDGSVSNAPGGPQLRGRDGNWTWGPPTNQPWCPGCSRVDLDGRSSGGNATRMQISQQGRMFVLNRDGWWRWDGHWVQVNAP